MSHASPAPIVRGLLVTIAVLVGIIVGQVGGILAVVGGATIATAFVTGAVAFAGAVTLILLIEKSLGVI